MASGVGAILGLVACGSGWVFGLLTKPGIGMGEGYFHWMLYSGIGLLVGVPMLLLSLLFVLMAVLMPALLDDRG